MATLTSNYLTLADWAKRLDPNGKTDKIVELLSQRNEMLQSMIFTEGNLPTGHRFTMRTGLPSVYWKLMNQGTPISKSTTAQVDEQTAMLEAFSEIDCAEADLNGNEKSFRLSEQMSFLESMNQSMQETVIYGSASNPEEFVGLAPRYSSLSATNSQNILSAGGSGSDNTSIWLVGWGQDGCYGIFPKGSQAGVNHVDLGKQMIQTDDSGTPRRMMAYVDHWMWKMGICVKDWRYVVRIPNIDVSDLTSLSGTQAITASTSIIKLMSRALHRPPTMQGVKWEFYCNRTTLSMLDIIGLDQSSSAVKVQDALDQFGKPQTQYSFRGVPIKVVDKITNAETAVA